jgi:hypothetical protein
LSFRTFGLVSITTFLNWHDTKINKKYSFKNNLLSQYEKDQLIDCAKNVFEVLNLRHHAIVDFRVHPTRGIYVLEANSNCHIIEVNGLTGEGAIDIAGYIKNSNDVCSEKLTLKHSMPSAICGYCYGNKIISEKAVRDRYLKGKELKGLLPNLNCGKCGFKSCNEFIRAVLDGKAEKGQCPFIK